MTPAEIKQARTRLGLTQAQLAQHFGRSRRTIEDWERTSRKSSPPPELRRAFRDLERELADRRTD